MNTNKSDKLIWTDDDFEQMGWHDCLVYTIGFDPKNFDISFELDYIIEWIKPYETRTHYQFWIVPATLTFHFVKDVALFLTSTSFIIDDVDRAKRNPLKIFSQSQKELDYSWTIATTEGEMTFDARGYTQTIKGKPLLTDKPFLSYNERVHSMTLLADEPKTL